MSSKNKSFVTVTFVNTSLCIIIKLCTILLSQLYIFIYKSIRDNHKGLPVAVNYNQFDHSINDLSCVILNEISQLRQTDSFMNRYAYKNSTPTNVV